MGGGGTKESSNLTSHSALGDYPTLEKREEKRGKERKERLAKRSENENNIPVPRLFHSVKRHVLIKTILAFFL